MAMADALWTWTAGTVSASWAGEERAAILPWRRHVAMGKTTTEVGHEHMWYVRLRGAYKPCTVNRQLDLVLQGRLFLTVGGEQWSLPGWLSQKRFEFTWNRFGLEAEEGGLFILKSSPYSREQAEAKCSSCHSTLARSLNSDTIGPPQTPNTPDCSNFGLTAGGFHQGSWVGHYWLGMDVS